MCFHWGIKTNYVDGVLFLIVVSAVVIAGASSFLSHKDCKNQIVHHGLESGISFFSMGYFRDSPSLTLTGYFPNFHMICILSHTRSDRRCLV
jgi:hypothetical protein